MFVFRLFRYLFGKRSTDSKGTHVHHAILMQHGQHKTLLHLTKREGSCASYQYVSHNRPQDVIDMKRVYSTNMTLGDMLDICADVTCAKQQTLMQGHPCNNWCFMVLHGVRCKFEDIENGNCKLYVVSMYSKYPESIRNDTFTCIG